MKREPYPLSWPSTWPRTPPTVYRRARFHTGVAQAVRDILHELRLLGARQVVITSNLPVRRDGRPYAVEREPDDRGVAVWWVSKEGKETVIACDRWDRVRDNMTAIANSVGALRGLDRWGVSEMMRRAFAGFAALPPGSGEGEGEATTPESAPRPPRDWREVLGGNFPEADPDDIIAIARARHRMLMRAAHPDKGGSDAAATELNDAMERAQDWFNRQLADLLDLKSRPRGP
jgi:hypothetical protein